MRADSLLSIQLHMFSFLFQDMTHTQKPHPSIYVNTITCFIVLALLDIHVHVVYNLTTCNCDCNFHNAKQLSLFFLYMNVILTPEQGNWDGARH